MPLNIDNNLLDYRIFVDKDDSYGNKSKVTKEKKL